jgi:hypothetical protein
MISCDRYAIVQISLLRQALQKADPDNETGAFTNLAFDTDEATRIDLARHDGSVG